MKRVLLLILFPIVVFSQNNTIDSLQTELNKALPDTSKVNALNLLSIEIEKHNPQQAIKYYNLVNVGNNSPSS